jgi:transposase
MTSALKSDQTPLPDEVNQLQKLVTTLRDEISWLKERVGWFERQMFGKRSERIIEPKNDDTLYLKGFEPEGNPKPSEPEKGKKKTPKKPPKRKPKNDYSSGLVIPENLPVEQIVIDLPEEKKVCPETGEKLIKIGEEVTRQLAHRSAEYFVKETIRPKYALPSREEEGIFVQDLPDSILPKSRADESLLAEIVVRKYADHLPLYRLSEIFSRDDIQISRQLLSQWIIRLGNTLEPLYDLMLNQIKESGIGYVDETPVKLQVKGKGRLQQAYMWVLAGGEGADPPHRVYWFCENRKHQNAFDLLEGFSGVLHSDKYGAYEQLSKKEEILWQPCWGHIRRKFEEAESGDPEFRAIVLRKIRCLFMFERVAWARDEKERLRIRKEKEAPIIDELIAAVKDRVENGKALPKSKLGIALNYMYGLIPHLKNYHHDPNARMDNMVAERAMRPLAIGRKNWLFAGSMQGGKATAVLLSLVQTCRALNINPRDYLEDVMSRFFSHPANQLSELLPNQWATNRQKPSVKTKPLHVR